MPDVLTAIEAILAPARSALLVVDVQHDFIHPDGWAARHPSGRPVAASRDPADQSV